MRSLPICVTDKTVNGYCSGCGECCSNFLPMSDDDVRTIHRYLERHSIKEQRHNAMVGADCTCPFRSEADKMCLIYQVRPAICRKFQCNHTLEDIQNDRDSFHHMLPIVDMRNEFFGNKECDELMKLYTASALMMQRR